MAFEKHRPENDKCDEMPPKQEFSVTFKQRQRRKFPLPNGPAKRMIAKLSKGVLKVMEPSPVECKQRAISVHRDIDLGKDDVRYDEKRREILVVYEKTLYYLRLTDTSDESFTSFRNAVQRHTWFRRYQIEDRGIESLSEYTAAPAKSTDVTSAEKPRSEPETTETEPTNNAKK